MSKSQRSPDEVLTLIFEIIREEAVANPNFAKRLLEAAGAQVVFNGPEAATAADPVIAAARFEYDVFREMFLTFREPDLKKLIKSYALATDEQVRSVKTRPKKDGMIDLMWDGAKRRLRERGL